MFYKEIENKNTMDDGFLKFCSVFVFQFVTDGSDQSVLKPIVEYCVVCGDKASGKKHKPNKNGALCPLKGHSVVVLCSTFVFK